MRALSRNTRRATAVTLAAALVIAVYLNWQYARSDVPTELPDNAAMVAAEAENVPVQTQTVLDELPTEAEAVSSANKNYGEAQLVSVASDSGAKFFEQARLKRQKAHDEAMDSIKKTMKSSSLSAEEKKEYLSKVTGVCLGSDAFFPFGDNIERARRSGVTAIVQPGGSIRDQQVIDTCNKYGIAMAFCGLRLFHH